MSVILLDRDGVINHEPAGGVTSADAWDPLPGSIEAIAALSRAGYQLVIATNQPGLARGEFDLDDLEAMHAKMRALVEDAGGEIAAIFYCPHGPDDGCRCRKPATGMLDAIEAEFDTSLHDCYFVGDRLRDLQAAVAKGCKPVLVRTGQGEATLRSLLESPDAALAETTVFDDLAAFSQFVLL
ncbi:D-glycero-beta-D-manno-heptose 1,7-bisphosphate 7-phosphatase [Microbulbifer guangxiensis]|uniref:D-glycero-beta-D-manno-heptose 1,7-bisphosphate 7-phosphatase n=1 Tax=Microbulbifer guangxiensis TaxID=2904249 RepID=UPI001F0017FC|nr:D-glycero-beta-D-manno-heptose 1,7-bisphosphate 7-phosphatase [Microbulbifer guangxiensis]